MKKMLLWLLAGLSALPALAQPDTNRANKARRPAPSTDESAIPALFQQLNLQNNANPFGLVLRTDNRYEGVQGTPYFLDTWTNGRIDLVDGRAYDKVPIKFDAYSQHLLLRRDTQRDSIVVFPTQVRQFLLRADDGAEWLFRHYPAAREAEFKDTYFLVLYDGKTALLKRTGKVLRKANYKDPYSTDVRYDAYTNEYTYYLLKPNGALTKVKKTKKAFLDALADKSDQLEAFITQEKLSFKSDADFASLLKKYNEL